MAAVNLYLPIAEISVNMLVIIGMGAAVGFLSGMFGVGGGFLITPLLIFYNIPPAVAVATGGNQVIAASFSGALAHYKRGTIDLKLGFMLLVGGAVGSVLGVMLFTLLRRLGQLDLVISILYVLLLGSVGVLMLVESINAMRRVHAGGSGEVRRHGQHNWVHRLPLKMRFQRSKLYVSVIPVLGLGFIMVPAMIYLLRVPTSVVIGTSLFQIIFTAAISTIMQAATNTTVDVVLAFLLMLGGVVGAQFGAQAGRKLRGEQLRALLALLVLAVCIRLGVELVVYPSDIYSISLPSGEAK
jgi:uncharacterized membrane protein YfcA